MKSGNGWGLRSEDCAVRCRQSDCGGLLVSIGPRSALASLITNGVKHHRSHFVTSLTATNTPLRKRFQAVFTPITRLPCLVIEAPQPGGVTLSLWLPPPLKVALVACLPVREQASSIHHIASFPLL